MVPIAWQVQIDAEEFSGSSPRVPAHLADQRLCSHLEGKGTSSKFQRTSLAAGGLKLIPLFKH